MAKPSNLGGRRAVLSNLDSEQKKCLTTSSRTNICTNRREEYNKYLEITRTLVGSVSAVVTKKLWSIEDIVALVN